MSPRIITPAAIQEFLQTKYPNLEQALRIQNWYSFCEALEDLTEFANTDILNYAIKIEPKIDSCTCTVEHTRVYYDGNKELAKHNPYCYECRKPIARNQLTEQELNTSIAILQEFEKKSCHYIRGAKP